MPTTQGASGKLSFTRPEMQFHSWKNRVLVSKICTTIFYALRTQVRTDLRAGKNTFVSMLDTGLYHREQWSFLSSLYCMRACNGLSHTLSPAAWKMQIIKKLRGHQNAVYCGSALMLCVEFAYVFFWTLRYFLMRTFLCNRYCSIYASLL